MDQILQQVADTGVANMQKLTEREIPSLLKHLYLKEALW